MVAFLKNCDILIKDNTLKRRVHGMSDSRERRTVHTGCCDCLIHKAMEDQL